MNTKNRTSWTWHICAPFRPELPQRTGNELGLLRAVVLGLVLALGVLLVPRANAAGGDVDPAFVADPNDQVRAVAVQPDGKVLIAGDFSRVNDFPNGAARNGIARLNADGSVDTTFMNGLSGAQNARRVYAVAVQADGKVLIGGDFQNVNGEACSGIARLNTDGTLDSSFMAQGSPRVTSVVVQTDGKVVIGGDFRTVNGVTRNGIARLNADGTLDTSFASVTFRGSDTSPTDWSVWAVAVQPDGKVLVAGWFTRVNGVARTSVARLNADGSLDTAFAGITLAGSVPFYLPVFAVATQSDGKVLIGGQFSQVNGSPRPGLARLNADGTLDTTFVGGASPRAIAVQPDGKVLIGGFFTKVNGVTRNRIARLNADGSLDATFMNGLSGVTAAGDPVVLAVTLQPDGKVLLGGAFGYVNGLTRLCLARLLSSSSNADLSSLVLSRGALAPPFAAGTTTYNADVTNDIVSITVTPTASDTGATIRVNGVTVASGSASGAINLNVGANTIYVVVTAGDGATTKTYTITVTRHAIKVYLPLVIR